MALIDTDTFEPWHLELSEMVTIRADIRSRSLPSFDYDASQKLGVLLLAEKCVTAGIKPEATVDQTNLHHYVCVLEHDLFAHGYTAYNPVTTAQIHQIFEALVEDPVCGVEIWLCKESGRLPTTSWLKRLNAHGWELTLCTNAAGEETLECVFHGKTEYLFNSHNRTDKLQRDTAEWFAKTFERNLYAPDQQLDRANRFFEEALELYQAAGASKEAVLQQVDYVYSRPVGEVQQEMGGVLVTLSLLASNLGLGIVESWQRGIADGYARLERIRAKDKAKREGSPLPGDAP